MQTERQRRIRALFDAASAQPAESQREFVHRSCGNEPEVEAAVLRLLRAGRQSGDFLSQPVWSQGAPALREGLRIGPYKIVRPLGEGGMGVVYLAVRADEVFRRVVALKVIRPEFKTPQLVRHFQREREILGELDHPNIARILDGGTTETGLPYFVLDYIEGEPIHLFCRDRRASLQQRLNLFRQACSAVDYLHSHRTVHRDLKPANILVTKDGVVKLLDFGIAKVLGAQNEITSTTSGQHMTLGYASPEQVSGKPLGPGTDIYSLGVILYEMVTGVRPYELGKKSAEEVIREICEQSPPRPSMRVTEHVLSPKVAVEMRARLKGDLDAIVLMALRKEPQRRYLSAADFAGDVERYQNQQPVRARRNSLVYVGSKLIRRQAKTIAASVMIAGSLAWGGWEYHEARRWEQHTPQVVEDLILRAEARHSQTPSKAGVNELRADLNQFSSDYGESLNEVFRQPFISLARRQAIAQQGLEYLAQVALEAEKDPGTAADLGRAYLTVGQAQARASLSDARTTCQTGLDKLGPALARFEGSGVGDKETQDLEQVASQLGALLGMVSTEAR